MKRLPLYPKFPDAPLSLAATLPQNPGCELCVLSKGTPSGQRCLSAEGVAGDILVVGEYPVEMERRMGRGFLSPPNKMLRDMLDRVAPGRKVVFANALGCSVPHTAEVGEAEATACRPYLADVLVEAKPQVILLLGPVAAMSVLGRSYQPLSVRKGYGWLRRSDGVLVPAFLLIQPREASRNPLMARALEEDLAWALNNPALQKAHFDAVCEVVETGADADEAFEHLMAQSEFLGTDVEASGMMHEDDYQIECLSISSGERTFVYPRQAFARPEIRYPLGLVLEGGQHTSWNGQYDWCGIAADPILREFRLNLQSDARIKRKLYEADARAKLEIAAELVGMGGHKEENHAVVEAICAELRTFAMSHLLTPTGKTRKWGGAKWFMSKEIPPQWVEWLNAEIAPEKFAHRFVPAEIEWRYNALDALSTWHLERWAMDKILNWEDGGLLAIWEEVSKPAMWAYNRMRLNGFPIDRQMLQTFRIWLEGEMAVSLKKIHGHKAGLNPLSNPQVVALMTELGLKTKRKTDSGKISASKEVLDELKDKSPVIGQISHYRTLQKIHGTYAVGLDPWIRSDGKVHASFLQDGTECMPAGELVLTDRGYLAVEQVRVGDLVLTHEGRPRKVTETSTHPPSVIYKTTLSNGLSLRTTNNHAYLAQGGFWLRADELQPGEHFVRTHSEAEVWRSVPGWSSFEVSSWGRVRNKRTRRFLQPQKKGKWGHLKVTLHRGGAHKRGPDRKDFVVHRLVMEAFGAPPMSGGELEVRHLNGIAWDNTLGNLAWGTSKENKADAHKHGTMSHRTRSAQVKFTQELADLVRSIPRESLSDQEAADCAGVSRELIRDVRLGKKWAPEVHIEGKRASFSAAQVVSVELQPAEITYGLTVEEDHSHVTAGVVTHNTGRPSSADPNLFNIAKGKDEASKEVATMLRGCFIAPPGWTIIEADSKQIEIRAAADLSGDPEMLAPIVAGADFHMNSAKKFAVAQGKDPEAVTDMDRDNAKTSVFAALYEIPCELGFMLSMRLKIPREDGGRLGGAMFKSFAQLRAWMDGQYADAHRTGRARTIWRGAPGRSRPLWGMGFNPATLKALETALEGERGSRSSGPSRYDKGAARSTYNGPSQGTAVDIIGSMLWRAQVWLDKNTRGGMLILQVYDSIMLLVRDEEVTKTVKFLQLLMTDQLEEKMGYTRFAPLGVDVKTGKAWSKMEKWKG